MLNLALMIMGCAKEQEVVLPFETIEKADTPGTGNNYQGNEPKLEILIDGSEIETVAEYVSPETETILGGVDYDHYFVIAVFQGRKGSTGYGVEIQKIIRGGNRIVIHVYFTEKEPHLPAAAMETSPYHLVKISRDGLQGDFQFILNVDGKVKIRQNLSIP